jgi:hypothetical protein
MSQTIVSLGVGGWYPRGIERLARSCQKHNAPYYLQTEYPKGVPTHHQIPYAFKPYMIRQVALSNNVVLWLDSSCWLQHSVQPLFDHIEKHGYLFFDGGWSNAQWCNDKQLEAFGFTRDEAEKQKHVIGGIVGLNLDTEIGKEIFAEWFLNIDLFKGNWNNDNLTESQDARCLGSRHDQSVLSLIAAKLNLNITPCAGWLNFDVTDKLAVIVAQGM